ncbi:shikimate dehydrogenase family protein [Leptospira sp. GIMC2001]|uniref:shikimate dehydrogenase family protein n=1 Tax=Leptospira sp. GIMC2001 TaxID=1513297 RepID=UPI002349C926|nr:shikimate dehydrogenase [Leptospira sp. GIMC2001]WCL50383.1 shikimate dehydrogenase [Leptospira sp. GIMC2001]
MNNLRFSNETEIFGIIGNPLSHTLSPVLHNGLFQDHRMNRVYMVFPIENPTKDELLTLNRYGLRGLSVTIPYKEWAYQIADILDPTAERMGAANTLLFTDKGIVAYNTDGIGALESILNKNPKLVEQSESGDILILGYGGSARGIAFAILDYMMQKSKPDMNGSSIDKGIIQKKIFIAGRDPIKAENLIQDLRKFSHLLIDFIPLEKIEPNSLDNVKLLIHTTPAGMKNNSIENIIPNNCIHSSMTVFDIVYNPKKTNLLIAAKKKSAKIIYGLDMLLYQGMRQFELFTGVSPTKKDIRKSKQRLIKNLQK